MIFQPIAPFDQREDKRNLRFYLAIWHFGEYELPTYPGLHIRKQFDSYQAFDIIKESELVKPNTQEEVDKVVMKIYKERVKKVQCQADIPEDPTPIYEFTIWLESDRKDYQVDILFWLDRCFVTATAAMLNASGDDDYYDYMPAYVELVADILNITGNKTEAEYLLTELKNLPQ